MNISRSKTEFSSLYVNMLILLETILQKSFYKGCGIFNSVSLPIQIFQKKRKK